MEHEKVVTDKKDLNSIFLKPKGLIWMHKNNTLQLYVAKMETTPFFLICLILMYILHNMKIYIHIKPRGWIRDHPVVHLLFCSTHVDRPDVLGMSYRMCQSMYLD